MIWGQSVVLLHILTHMSRRNIWINFEAPQQYICHNNPCKKCSNLMQFLKYLAEPFLSPLRLKDWGLRSLRLWPRNFATIFESLAANLERQINQNFGTVCHTEVCLTFSRLAAKLSGMILKFRGRNLNTTSMTSDLKPLTSMASKTALPNILKIASNCCIFCKN